MNKFCILSTAVLILSALVASQSSQGDIVPNKYVLASPPCIAAVCKNGISIVALHTNIQANPYMDEDSNDDDKESDLNSKYEQDKKSEPELLKNICIFPDLPMDSRNPVRIERVDGRGSALVTCGWRTDGMVLADVARGLCSDECMRYGKRQPKPIQSTNEDYYGRWLGWGLAKYLIRSEARENTRSLSTIGLLATANQRHGGELHLIDTTGISKCRACAIGKHSSQLNERLSKESFEHLTIEEGSQLLLSIIQECSAGSKEKYDDKNIDSHSYGAWNLPSQTFVEILVVDSMRSKVRRLRQPLI